MKAVIICGPTGSGKSAAAMKIAERYQCSIVSADSRQVYRRLDIGTAKPSAEDRRRIPHYMIDIADISDDFTAMRFVREAISCFELISRDNRIPLVVGGTGLYIEALTKGIIIAPDKDDNIRAELKDIADRDGLEALYHQLEDVDPKTAEKLSPNDEVRIFRALEIHKRSGIIPSVMKESDNYIKAEADFLWIGLDMPREFLYQRIDSRVDSMIAAGLIDEIKRLMADGLGGYILNKKIVGYDEIIDALANDTDLNEAVELVKQHSRNYGKRQLTWFRNKTETNWLNPNDPDFESKVIFLLDEHLKRA